MAMLKVSLAFFVLGFSSFSCFIMTTARPYDYFQLVQQWPPTSCRISKKPCQNHRPLQRFTIHGLWPSNYTNPGRPSRCTGTKFNNVPPSLQSKLRRSWPNVEGSNDTEFWEYEWTKHGTCSQGTLNQFQYFEESHEMWTSYNITNILKNAQIVPSATKRWKYSDIAAPIEKATERIVLLRCKPVPVQPGQPKANYQLLHEVVFCYEYHAIKQIDCNRTAGCQNQLDILFP